MDSVNVSLALKPNERYIGYRQFGHCVFLRFTLSRHGCLLMWRKITRKRKSSVAFTAISHLHHSSESWALRNFWDVKIKRKCQSKWKKNQKFRVFFLEDIFARVSLSVAAAIKMATRCWLSKVFYNLCVRPFCSWHFRQIHTDVPRSSRIFSKITLNETIN